MGNGNWAFFHRQKNGVAGPYILKAYEKIST